MCIRCTSGGQGSRLLRLIHMSLEWPSVAGGVVNGFSERMSNPSVYRSHDVTICSGVKKMASCS